MTYDPNTNPNLAQEQYLPSLDAYTSRTFLWMVLGLMITFAVAMVMWMTGVVEIAMNFHFVFLIASVLLAVSMGNRIEGMSVSAAVTLFLLYSAVLGVTVSVYLMMYGVTDVVLVFLCTALYFAILSAYGKLTQHNLSSIRTVLFSGLVFLLIFSVLSLFIPGMQALDRTVCILGIAIFLGNTAYDTQMIRDFYHYYYGYPDLMEKASIFAALRLYMDFINLFLYLLRYLGTRKNN